MLGTSLRMWIAFPHQKGHLSLGSYSKVIVSRHWFTKSLNSLKWGERAAPHAFFLLLLTSHCCQQLQEAAVLCQVSLIGPVIAQVCFCPGQPVQNCLTFPLSFETISTFKASLQSSSSTQEPSHLKSHWLITFIISIKSLHSRTLVAVLISQREHRPVTYNTEETILEVCLPESNLLENEQKASKSCIAIFLPSRKDPTCVFMWACLYTFVQK